MLSQPPPTFGELTRSSASASVAAASTPPDRGFLGTAAASPTALSLSSTKVGTNLACNNGGTTTLAAGVVYGLTTTFTTTAVIEG